MVDLEETSRSRGGWVSARLPFLSRLNDNEMNKEGGGPLRSVEGLGITVLRVVVGIVFIAHGGQKLFVYHFAGVARNFAALGIPLPEPAAVAVTLLEFLGGLLLVAGLFTRWTALLLACDMAVALLAAHIKHGFWAPYGIEYPLVLLAVNVALALNGPGAAALDQKLSRNRIFP